MLKRDRHILNKLKNVYGKSKLYEYITYIDCLYFNDDRIGIEERVIQPVAYGVSKAGNLVLRAFQPQGDTKTQVPHWKLFRLDRIVSWKALRNEIMYSPPNEQYNPLGDRTMKSVYRNADFKRSRYTNTSLSDYNRKRRSRKPIEDNRLVLGIEKK